MGPQLDHDLSSFQSRGESQITLYKILHLLIMDGVSTNP